jgi:2-dehydropantoate 2-reductase
MRILVVGAGAVGGYFGGRLAEAGRDVTFLVRPRRAAELAEAGLVVRSRFGDITIPSPRTVLAENLAETFDLLLLSCKAYDLEDAMASFAPAVGQGTAILPLLNGMRHLDILSDRFGEARVLGGQCLIAATLNPAHEIVHLSDMHAIAYGEPDGRATERVAAIEATMQGVRFDSRASTTIRLDMWEKWVFLATLAGITCLMRASIGDVVSAPRGVDFVLRLFAECRAIAAAQGYAPRLAFLDRSRTTLTAAGSPLTASMLRDIEGGARIEGDHVIGHLLECGEAHRVACELLPIVYEHLKAYEARRARQTS